MTELDVLPFPLPGFVTLIDLFPAVATSLLRTLAVNLPLLTNVVCRPLPLMYAVAPDWNPLPLIVRVNAVPAATLEGDMLLMVGELPPPPPALTVKISPFESPPGVVTVTTKFPAVTEASIVTNAMTWESEFCVMLVEIAADGLNVMPEALERLDPWSVRVNVVPAGSEAGLKLLRDGCGVPFTTSNKMELDVPTGLATLRKNWPVGVELSMFMLAVT